MTLWADLQTELHTAFADPLYPVVVFGGTAVAIGSLLLFAIPYTLIAVYDIPLFRAYKIQTQSKESARDKVMPCLRSLLVNYTSTLFTSSLAWPLLRRIGPTDGPWPSAVTVVLSVAFCAVVEDAWFYGTHRLLHERLYRWHKQHHEHTTPIALSGAYMSTIEHNIITTGVLMPLCLLRAHWVTTFVWLFFRNWDTAEAHCGYDFPWAPSRLLPGYDPAFHDFHHSKYNGNYAALFSFWDYRFGTIAPGYAAFMAKRFGAKAHDAASAASLSPIVSPKSASASGSTDSDSVPSVIAAPLESPGETPRSGGLRAR